MYKKTGPELPTIKQISKRYADDASFWLVFPDKRETVQAIRKYLQDYGYHLPALRDPKHELVKLSRVQVTPEAAVFDRNHRLVYDGRIDDWYRYPGGSRPAPTTHDLDDSVRAAIAGVHEDPDRLRAPVRRTRVRGIVSYLALRTMGT